MKYIALLCVLGLVLVNTAYGACPAQQNNSSNSTAINLTPIRQFSANDTFETIYAAMSAMHYQRILDEINVTKSKPHKNCAARSARLQSEIVTKFNFNAPNVVTDIHNR